MTLPNTPILPVVQGDREAAALLSEWLTASQKEWDGMAVWFAADFPEGVRRGIWDNHEFVQALARHRIASQAELLAESASLISALLEDYPDEPEEADSAPVENIGECSQSALTFGHVRRLHAAIASARGAS